MSGQEIAELKPWMGAQSGRKASDLMRGKAEAAGFAGVYGAGEWEEAGVEAQTATVRKLEAKVKVQQDTVVKLEWDERKLVDSLTGTINAKLKEIEDHFRSELARKLPNWARMQQAEIDQAQHNESQRTRPSSPPQTCPYPGDHAAPTRHRLQDLGRIPGRPVGNSLKVSRRLEQWSLSRRPSIRLSATKPGPSCGPCTWSRRSNPIDLFVKEKTCVAPLPQCRLNRPRAAHDGGGGSAGSPRGTNPLATLAVRTGTGTAPHWRGRPLPPPRI